MSSSVLVVSNKQDVFTAITRCLDGNFHVEQTVNWGDALGMAGRKNQPRRSLCRRYHKADSQIDEKARHPQGGFQRHGRVLRIISSVENASESSA